MSSEFITFEIFNTLESAKNLSVIHDENKIEHTLEDTSLNFDPTFANNDFGKEFRIKVKQSDFNKVSELLLKNIESELSNIPENYYLLDFSDEELEEVILKRDEWNNYDYVLAQKLLKERGKVITPEQLKNFENSRIHQLSKPEESQNSWIIAGYFFALLGGLLGLFIGWHLMTHKKTLPNGTRIYTYSLKDRKSGNVIFIIAISSIAFWIIFYLLK